MLISSSPTFLFSNIFFAFLLWGKIILNTWFFLSYWSFPRMVRFIHKIFHIQCYLYFSFYFYLDVAYCFFFPHKFTRVACSIYVTIFLGTFLLVQWLGLCTPNAGGPGMIPDQQTRSHMPQLKILHAITKTQHYQIN